MHSFFLLLEQTWIIMSISQIRPGLHIFCLHIFTETFSLVKWYNAIQRDTVPGSVETLYPHCPGQYGDNISVVPLALQRYCMEYPLTMYRGSPETLLGVTRDNEEVACFVWLA